MPILSAFGRPEIWIVPVPDVPFLLFHLTPLCLKQLRNIDLTTFVNADLHYILTHTLILVILKLLTIFKISSFPRDKSRVVVNICIAPPEPVWDSPI